MKVYISSMNYGGTPGDSHYTVFSTKEAAVNDFKSNLDDGKGIFLGEIELANRIEIDGLYFEESSTNKEERPPLKECQEAALENLEVFLDFGDTWFVAKVEEKEIIGE